MRYLAWLCLIVACFLLACGKDKGASAPGNQEKRLVVSDALLFDDTTGLVYQRGESEPFTGKAVWFHPDGQLQQETAYLNGKEHGTEIWWHENGTRAGQSAYREGVLDGPTLQWYPGGQQKQFQTLFQKGKQIGREIWWHENSREKSVTTFVAGQRQGKAEGWYDDGTLAWEANWKDDQPHGAYSEWYPSSLPKSVKHYAEGTEEGVETWWYEQGEKSWEVTWKAGRMEGLLIEWYENGQKLSQTPHKAGLREGVATGWYEDGTKAFETTYLEDEEVGIREWLETGEEVKPPPEAVARVKVWKEGEIEKIYAGKPEENVYAAFGEPDQSVNGAWIFEGIKLDGGDQTLLRNVSFTFKSGKVESVKVEKPAAKPKPEPEPEPDPEKKQEST